jgi:hypothetical protein
LTTALYLVASTCLLALFGAGPAKALSGRDGTPAGVAGVAYGVGGLLLTVEALAFSALGIPWSVAGLSAPLLLLSAFLFWRERGRSAGAGRQAFRRRQRLAASQAATPMPPAPAAAVVVTALAAAVFAIGLVNSSANSVDFVLFYGVKAVLFAKGRGLSAAVLGHPLFAHAAPRYPPLMPVVESWGVLVAGDLPWRFGTAISFAWFAASVAAIGSRLRRRLGPESGAAVAAYWAAALALSFNFSYSGGNGEAPLVFFVSASAAWLLTETPGESRWLPAVLLAGAALSKQEGLLAAIALASGTVLRDALEKRPGTLRRGALAIALPVGGVLLWFAYEGLAGLPVGYAPPAPISGMDVRALPRIVPDLLRNLSAGTWGLSWALPLALLVLTRTRGRLVAALPVTVTAAALTGALLATYASPAAIDRADVIGRTLPRACQPVLSLLILGAGLAAGRWDMVGRLRWTGAARESS